MSDVERGPIGGLTGRTVVVTGGGGGLGHVTCVRFAQQGAVVAVTDVDGRAAETTASVLNDAGGSAHGFELDVSDADAVQRAFDAIAEQLGAPNVLVTLAGGSLGTPRDLAEISTDDFDLVVDVNLRGTFSCCQAAVPHMIEAGGGAIVTVSSIGGRTNSPVTGVPYAAAKAGVLGLTRRLAREVGPFGIRVNAVAPGLFLSGPRLVGMWESLSGEEKREVLDSIPLSRMPELHEAADPILFLASDAASYITGTVIDVNGGRFMAG
ncbi:MAG: SDR family NAD(P)-dependent oxidoreductase [Acidimicrobiia bacterium]